MKESGTEFSVNDRRCDIRAEKSIRIAYKTPKTQQNANDSFCITRDISPNGSCVLLNEQLQPGTSISLSLNLSANETLLLSGVVKWSQPTRQASSIRAPLYLTGVELVCLTVSDKERLGSVIANVLEAKRESDESELIHAYQRSLSVPTTDKIQTTSFKTMLGRVVSTGSYLPSSVVKNSDLVHEKREAFDTIVRRAVGAVERRAALPGETNADMMTYAAKQILQQTRISASHISRIICSADPQDRIAPNVASIVQANIGATCPAFDVQMSCAGWICGLDIALRCIQNSIEPTYVLVLASATVGSRLNFFNKQNRAIFGDGASGLLLAADNLENNKLMCTQLWTDGRFHNDITAPMPWSKRPSSVPENYEGSFYMSPDQDVFFGSLSRVLPQFFESLLSNADLGINDIDHFILHQPSMPLFNHSVKILPAIPKHKIFDCFEKYGNLIAAEMPMMLSDGIRSGRVGLGDKILMLTYGAGFTMAGCIFEY